MVQNAIHIPIAAISIAVAANTIADTKLKFPLGAISTNDHTVTAALSKIRGAIILHMVRMLFTIGGGSRGASPGLGWKVAKMPYRNPKTANNTELAVKDASNAVIEKVSAITERTTLGLYDIQSD